LGFRICYPDGIFSKVTEKTINQVFQIGEEYQGMRLDYFLARQFPQTSRVVLRDAIATGQVLVNGRKLRSKYKLQVGDCVEVEVPLTSHPAFMPEPIPIQIVFEDAHILVVDKPAGMLVHPNRETGTGTLMNALCYYLQQNDPGSRPGLIHRLDRHTSGLIVVAKTEHAHRVLARHFRQRMVVKKYLALVYGEMSLDSLEISLPIGWVPDVFPHWQVTDQGREAITGLCVLERFPGFTLIGAELKTGRTHQIRIHLAAIGHPLVGDATYGNEPQEASRPPVEKTGSTINRHFLHASYLQFRHPRSGEPLSFSSPLPKDLASLIDRIRS
jgi:23S rRNA pseudouridine1911/1915/1917 synthase